MTILSESVLLESKSARNNELERISYDSAQDILNKVKSLYFALWKGIGFATTEQVAEFYQVSVDAVQKVIQRHRDELESDRMTTLKGKELKALRAQALDTLSIPEATTILSVWTPRAALRLRMLLRDSAIAKVVRTTLLDAVKKVIPAQAKEIERLKLELELAETQERLMLTTGAIAQ